MIVTNYKNEGVYGIIYLITNQVNGKVYVGQTVGPLKTRFNQHTYHKRYTTLITNSIYKYGIENFTCEQIATAGTKEELEKLEIFWINTYDSKCPCGYNLRDGGLHGKLTEEAKRKLSEFHVGMTGKKHKPETIKKMSLKQSNRTDEHKKKLSKAMKGRKISAESAEKCRITLTGRKLPKEHIANVNAAMAKSVRTNPEKTSKYKGVYWCKHYEKWNCAVVFNKKEYKRYFVDENDGARFCDYLSSKFHNGECYLNFPNEVLTEFGFYLLLKRTELKHRKSKLHKELDVKYGK